MFLSQFLEDSDKVAQAQNFVYENFCHKLPIRRDLIKVLSADVAICQTSNKQTLRVLR